MNELAYKSDHLSKMVKGLVTTDRREIPNRIIDICKSISPQFYKVKPKEDVEHEQNAIAVLTEGIDIQVLSIMVRLAMRDYPLARSRNAQTYFDINYILTFYEKAFNWFWCDYIQIDSTFTYAGSDYNTYTNILTEYWTDKNGKQTVVKCILTEPADCHHYSPKARNLMFTNLDNLEL